MAETVRFDRDIAALEGVFSSVADFVREQGLDEAAAFALQFVVEELFTNLVRHNKRSHGCLAP